MSRIKQIGEYNGKPIYFDEHGSGVLRGPVAGQEENYQGLVYWNMKEGTMTQADGQPYRPKKLEYEIKAYLLPTEDMVEAIRIIEKYHHDRG